jgi:DNA-binding SARP family transcriptional activator
MLIRSAETQDAVTDIAEALFARFPRGLMLVSRTGAVVATNPELHRLVPLPPKGVATCCALLGCGDPETALAGGCITREVLRTGHACDGLRLRPSGTEHPLRVTATPLRAREGHVLIEVELDDTVDDRPGAPILRIRTLGRTSVEGPSGPLTGPWLHQRPGELLKLLVTSRDRVLTAEQIAEALWPDAPYTATSTVRQLVHALRDRLEPDRGPGVAPRYVLARKGGYVLDGELVVVDADEFVRRTGAGLRAFAAMEPSATEQLEEALACYPGDFLSDEPYAHWATAERERLRDQVEQLLRALSTLAVARGELRAATDYLERLAELEPLDSDVHCELIGLMFAAGRRSRAARLFHSYERRLMRTFGERADFTLGEARASAPRVPPAEDRTPTCVARR